MKEELYFVREKETGHILIGMAIFGELLIAEKENKKDFEMVEKVPDDASKSAIRNMRHLKVR